MDLDFRPMPTTPRHLRPIAIIAASILFLGVAIYGVLLTIARVGDAHQRDMEQRIVRSALNAERARLSAMLVQQAYWDIAYDAVGETLNVKWVDANLGYSAEAAGVPITAILNAHARVVYRYSAHAAAADARVLQTSASLTALGRRALATAALPATAMTAFVRLGNTVYFGAAERIVPNDARAAQPLSRHYLLAYLVPLDLAALGSLQSGFGIAPLALSNVPPSDRAQVPLDDTKGTPLGYLVWRSARPGADFADAAAPLAVGCFIILAVLQLIVLRGWTQLAQRLHDDGVARGVFLANASHELRTPLNAIIGFSDSMAGELFGPLSARYREYAQDIGTSGRLLLNIVNDVLDLSQLNGGADIPTEPIRPGEALTGAIRMLREYAKGDCISIDYVDRSDGAEVAANEKTLSQIVLNLGSNAVKFSPENSSVDVVLQRGADCVELVVRDRGVGIPEDKLQFIGQPFFQAHPCAGRKQGSGLGLTIVKKLTARLGGEFDISSAVGAGTTVTVRLPQLRASRESIRASAA